MGWGGGGGACPRGSVQRGWHQELQHLPLDSCGVGDLSPGTETSGKPAARDCTSTWITDCFEIAYYVLSPMLGTKGDRESSVGHTSCLQGVYKRMRKMSYIQAAEGTEMSHPGPPSKTGGPSCWKCGQWSAL